MAAPTDREKQLFLMMSELAGSILAAEGLLINLVDALPDDPRRHEALEAYREMAARSRRYIDRMEEWNSGW